MTRRSQHHGPGCRVGDALHRAAQRAGMTMEEFALFASQMSTQLRQLEPPAPPALARVVSRRTFNEWGRWALAWPVFWRIQFCAFILGHVIGDILRGTW